MAGVTHARQPRPVETVRIAASARAQAQAQGQARPAPSFADPRASTLLTSRNVASTPAGDKRVFRSRDGKNIELPDDMSYEQAAQLERDALSAQAHLGKGPPPQPVPEVRKPADKKPKKNAGKGERPKHGPGGKGGAAPRTARVTARVDVPGGKVAQYLVGKARPVFARGAAALGVLSRHEQTHENAAQKVHEAEKAVVIPPSEGQSRGNAVQVDAVKARPEPRIDPSKGDSTLQASLQENVPRTIEDVDNFKRDMKAQHTGADVLQSMQVDKNAVVGTFSEMEHTPQPVPPEHAPEALPAPESAPGTGNMNLGRDAIAPLQPEHTDMSTFSREADGKLKEEGVTQEQLDMVDSGDLATANADKKKLDRDVRAAPGEMGKQVQQEAKRVDTELANEEREQRGKIVAHRKQGLGVASQKQKHAKSALEKKRDEVAAHINGVYTRAQAKVKSRLDALEQSSMKRFDDGNERASRVFEDTVKREIEAFKDDRYDGWFGWARRAKDWLLGMDDLPGVKAIFDRNRATFVSTIDHLVADITADNQRTIAECREELARARTEIADYVAKLGPSLRDIGKATANDVNGKLEQLDGFIRKREEDLQQKLADKQQAAIKAIDDKIEKMKDAMSGALSKLGKLLLWAAKKFFTWALQQFGYSLSEIEGIISKGAAVLKAIFTKPIVFVKNLMAAAIQGFRQFGANFLKHLKDALFEWLTGAIEGLVLPSTWDFKGIIGVALQMIGVSYANVRRHMVAVMGETVVVGLEKSFKLVKTLVTEGPMAAWEQLQEMAAEMRDAFVQALKDFIRDKIIMAAIEWVVGIFVPGAGIVKAVIGIYDTVVFFVQKAKDIIEMVGRFLGSIGEIAAGNIGAAADAMEAGLARGLVLVINFLARLLRLNGITDKIRKGIEKIRAKVDSTIEKVVKWIWEKAKAVFGNIKAGVKAFIGWWKQEAKFTADGESHRLFFSGDAKSAQLKVASTEKSLDDFLSDNKPATKASAKTKAAHKAVTKANNEIKTLRGQRKPPTPDGRDPVVDQKIEDNFKLIADNLPLLMSGDKWGSETNPATIVYPKKSASIYRTLYLGPRVSGRLKQSLLKDAMGHKRAKVAAGFDPKEEIPAHGNALNAWLDKGGVVKAYKPFESHPWPDGGSYGGSSTLGVAAQFLTQAGTSFDYDQGGTPGGKKLNDALKKFGYFGRVDGGEDSDGDHILEAQLIGKAKADQIPNMWPLDKGENRHGLSLEKNCETTVEGRSDLKFKGIGNAARSKDAKREKRSQGLRVMIKGTENSQ
ncbi:hypothetical protein [Scleromatobacter humisilvae]|uniref:Uncharacterized protein n=1 Tax=Scleromatobacter humisilvae TaxID=2897159 RepID=A0A9X1YL41_9BURK|nr:hypothetical protein [Scleromatobacter humisilvae]MCK9688554.1 hypothetical protein [Scleromatobacter humisilvae]